MVEVIHKEKKGMITKKYVVNGHTVRKYKFPKIETEFASPMVNDYNMNLCDGWIPNGIERIECITRVHTGDKPMGFYSTRDKDHYEKVLFQVEDWDLPYVAEFKDGRGEIGVSRPGTLGENFDLKALVRDYAKYGSDQSWLFNIRDEELEVWLGMDYANLKDAEDLVFVGLLLGYPVETTVAILIEDGEI